MEPFYGKYRGKVIENVDPMALGRLIARVPAISDSPLNFAMPCVPYAGPGVGFYMVPPIGADVWIEFEGGDPNHPIWTGCFWSEGELPFGEASPMMKVIKTEFITLILNDTPEEGGFTLMCRPPAVAVPLTMRFDSEGITMLCPEASITMTPESLELAVPEAVMSMNAETIELTVPPSTQTMTAEAVSIETPDMSIAAEGAVDVSAGADVSVEAGGAIEISGGGDVSVEAGGAAEITGGGDVALTAGGAAEVSAGADVAVTAGLAAEIQAGADIALTAVGATEITCIGIAMTGLVEVTGDLLIDGRQPLVK